MNQRQSFFKFFLGSALALFLFACGGEPKVPEPAAAEPESAGLMPAGGALFTGVVIHHTVADFGKWKAGFDANAKERDAAGLTVMSVLQDKNNPNDVTISMKAADLQKARDFTSSPALKDAMQKAGVTSAPEVNFYNVLRMNESAPAASDRLIVKHQVKDFDAWLKVFDADGTATRTTNGAVDRILARDADDPNMVLLSFAVTDMAKVQAFLGSEELKKKMESGGVEGQPQINFFTVAK